VRWRYHRFGRLRIDGILYRRAASHGSSRAHAPGVALVRCIVRTDRTTSRASTRTSPVTHGRMTGLDREDPLRAQLTGLHKPIGVMVR